MMLPDYSTTVDALKALNLQGRVQDIVQPIPHTIREDLTGRIALMNQFGCTQNEFGVAEGLVFPVVLEVWSSYVDELMVRNPVSFGPRGLQERPGYTISRIAFRGQMGLQPPHMVIVVARKEDFDEAWGQCLAAMTVARQLNGRPDLPVWGAVTSGRAWQFGKLEGSTFKQDSRHFLLSNLDLICGALRYVFEQVKQYSLPAPAAAQGAA